MRCWACRYPFRAKAIRRDGIIRGREPARGGPYRMYQCPRCHKESKVEENGRGDLFISPPKEMSVLDYLFGWIEPLAPEDFLRIVEWQAEQGEARRRFFEETGDRRYSGRLRRFLRWIRRPRHAAGERRERREARLRRRVPRERRTTAESRGPRPIPHPYRILGIEPGATEDEVRAAFHRLAKQWHPDKQRDPARVDEATRRWKELVRAYESIRRP